MAAVARQAELSGCRSAVTRPALSGHPGTVVKNSEPGSGRKVGIRFFSLRIQEDASFSKSHTRNF
jgi:hypothetical protein